MDVKYINPFVESVNDLFNTMFGFPVKRGELSVKKSSAEGSDVIALIGITGDVQGSVAVTMSVDTGLHLASALMGSEISVFDEVATDGVAEIVNMIAGGAKAKLHNGDGKPLQLSLPTVFKGTDFAVSYPTQSLWLDIPFETELGSFNLRVTMKNANLN